MNVLSVSLYYNLFYDSPANLYSFFFFCIIWILTAIIWTRFPDYHYSLYLFHIYLLVINLLFGGGYTLWECIRAASLTLLIFLKKYVVLFYTRFISLLSLFYTDHLVSIILFNYDYLNSTTILLCLCFYSLYYHFVNLNFICSNNNLCICLSFHFTYHTDEEIRDFKIYLSIISTDVILMSLFPHIFKWFFNIYIYIYIKFLI